MGIPRVAGAGSPAAIARFGSPQVARRIRLQARYRAAQRGLRMLVATGAVLVAASVAVDAVQPAVEWPQDRMPLALQWKLTLAGMFGLSAVIFGAASIWHRVREERATAIRYALIAVVAATPAVALHLVFQISRLSYGDHERWFTTLLAVSAGVRIGVIGAALIVLAQASHAFESAGLPRHVDDAIG